MILNRYIFFKLFRGYLILTFWYLLVTSSCENGVKPEIIPVAPLINNTEYQINGVREWYLKDKSLKSKFTSLQLSIHSPKTSSNINCWIDSNKVSTMSSFNGSYSCSISIQSYSYGTHQLILSHEDSARGFAQFNFNVSAPLCIVISNDWEAPDNSWEGGSNQSLIYQEQLHSSHQGLKITHFIGPYTFAANTLTKNRVDSLVNWHLKMEKQFGDEIGMHLHPYCSFLELAGISCLNDTPFCKSEPDTVGYKTGLFKYDALTISHLLKFSDSLFIMHGFAKPKSFRAGGWSASSETIECLARNGFKVDASKCNWPRWKTVSECPPLEEWMKKQWPKSSDTSQPYFPQDSQGNMLSILEVPNNGLLVDHINLSEMIDVVNANWEHSFLKKPIQLSFGYHPVSFDEHHYNEIDGILTYLDSFLADNDSGPIIYVTMSEIRDIFCGNQD